MISRYRATEQRMIVELLAKLNSSNIAFVKGLYGGSKDMLVICSPDNSFLTSM